MMTFGRPRMRRARGARVRFYFFLLLRRACARALGVHVRIRTNL
jgi:hypothetical protein